MAEEWGTINEILGHVGTCYCYLQAYLGHSDKQSVGCSARAQTLKQMEDIE